MAETKAEPGAGDVPIRLGEQDLVMRPTLECCRAIAKLAGDSLVNAIAKVNRLDFEFIVDVIANGLGETSPNIRKQVELQVYQTGIMAIAPDCILFIRTIMNGGKRPNDEEELGDEADGPLAESESASENIIGS